MSKLQEISYHGKKRTYFIHDFSSPKFSEVDSYNVLWNGHYVSYFEEARLELCRQHRIGLSDLKEMGYYLPVYRYDVKMKKPVFLNDPIRVAVRIESCDGAILFKQLLLVNDEIRAEAEVTHIFADAKTMAVQFSLPTHLEQLFSPLKEMFHEAH